MDRSPALLSVTVGLLAMSAVFWLLERWRPSLRAQRLEARQTRTDVAHRFFPPLVTRFVARAAVGLLFALLALSQGLTLDDLRKAVTTRRAPR